MKRAYLQAHSVQWEELKGSRDGTFLTGRLTHRLAVTHGLTLQITVEYGIVDKEVDEVTGESMSFRGS
jgi:hypothetical protein